MTDMPHRDASTDRLLRRHLPPSPEPPATDACLDADAAAAWIAGELSGAALEQARAHVADCARCQALMATLARLEADPVETDAVQAPAPWWRWLVPVGVVAAMLAVVLILPREPTAPTPAVVQEQQTAARQDDNKNLEFRPAPPAAETKKSASDEGRARDQKLEAPKPAAPVGTALSAGHAAAPPTAAAPPVSAAPAAPPTAANAALPPQQTAPPPAPPPSAAAAAAVDKTQPAGAANTKAADANAAGASSRNLGALQRAASPANELAGAIRAEVVSPDGATRWRISSRSVEKSTDGTTWTVAVTIAEGGFTAGAAASSTTLWVVGRSGLVERTVDGRTFTRVAFPATTDLSAVQATSAEIAIVTTADGRSFGTTDGGVTWVQRLVQETPAAPFKD